MVETLAKYKLFVAELIVVEVDTFFEDTEPPLTVCWWTMFLVIVGVGVLVIVGVGVRVLVGVGPLFTVTVATSLHVVPSISVALAVIVLIDGPETPVAEVLYGEELSVAGLTDTLLGEFEEKLTCCTDDRRKVTPAVRAADAPTLTVAVAGETVTLHWLGGVGVGAAITVIVK